MRCRVFAHFSCTACYQTDDVSAAAGLCFNEWMTGADVICCDWCVCLSASWIRLHIVAVHEVIFPHQAVIFLQDVVTLSSFDSVASCACCSTWPMKEGGGGGWSCCVLVLSVSAEQSFSVSLWQGDGVFRRWMSGILVAKLFASRLSSWSSLQEFVETAHGISCHVKLYFVDHECCMTDFFFFYQNVKFSFVLSR